MRHRPPRPELPPSWSDLLAPWDIPAATLSPALGGVNNRCWFVESASGRYLLRVYSVASLDAVRSEHALLAALSTAALPFATPRPVAAGDGSTCPMVMTPEGPRIAALFARIAGENLDDDDVAGIEAAAAAFAQLDVVLAQLDIDRGHFDGNLERVHPLIQDLTSLESSAPMPRRLSAVWPQSPRDCVACLSHASSSTATSHSATSCSPEAG
jgi:Ser/Thr protein kinase RdoA (MazF antagonist)